jgi:hypothetical protein
MLYDEDEPHRRYANQRHETRSPDIPSIGNGLIHRPLRFSTCIITCAWYSLVCIDTKLPEAKALSEYQTRGSLASICLSDAQQEQQHDQTPSKSQTSW